MMPASSSVLVFALIIAFSPVPFHAQEPPEALKQELIAIGFSNPYDRTLSLYQPLLSAQQRGGIRVRKDLAYGEHMRHKIDVYWKDDMRDAPVLVYVHGGGYARGDRDLNEWVYSNIPTYLAQHGVVGMNATYRLAPEVSWPSGAQDMRAMVRWVQAHAADYGGDANNIFLMGHSAGATHVATYAFDQRFQPAEGHGLSGIVLVSGRYAIKSDPDDPSLEGIRRYFGHDPSTYDSRSVVTHVPNSDVAAMLVIAEFDQRNLVETTGELFTTLCLRNGGRCPRLVQLKYHNHFSEIVHIGTGDNMLGSEILEFISAGAARQRRR